MGDQSRLHEGRRRLHQRIRARCRRSTARPSARRCCARRTDRERSVAGGAARPLRPQSVPGLPQCAGARARLLRRRRHQVRRHGDRAGGGLRPQADRQARSRAISPPPRPSNPIAACSAPARSSSRCGRSPGSTTVISTPRGPSTRCRARSRATLRDVSAVFANFESHRHNIELGFAAVFVMLSLTMLISAVWMGLDLRQPARRPDPAADPRHRRGRLRQSLRPGSDPALRGRPRPSRRDLQQDDDGAAPSAQSADRRQRAQRRTARLHRGGAVGRSGLRHRRRRAGRHHGQQRRRRQAAVRRRSARTGRPEHRRGLPSSGADPRSGAVDEPAVRTRRRRP